ncbi:putative NAD(P)-binding domain superfamily [Helianthus annuus]|nr:putative NAD(P)-binding domain superfamily [Helianthus annuus]KAJ0621728.1 putative NAD(P)-binding domain superfamily [Helianthus annuus]KAJ0828963.1 putative NAD(P)-binding domain superfamily [Helianthus annuus]KAJ0947081.1 putative NAD(P)-binding domain superfamily [Helianthus annuus]
MAGGVAAVQHNFKQYPSVSLLPSSQSTFCGTKFITSIQYKRKVCQPKGALNVTASSSKKILVMGGTRFIGIFLSRKLVEEGHQVTLFTRGKAPVTQPLPGEADDAYNAFKSKILHLKGDRKDYDFVRTSVAAGGFDVVYDINGREAEEVEPILDALPNLEQYIYCSSAGVYLKSDLLPHREIDAVDPKSRPIPIPNSGLQVTQLGHVKDLATAFIKVLGNAKASKQVYNISGDRYVTFDGLARACAKAGGFPEPELIHYNPKEFDFGKKKAFPFRDQHFFASVEKAKEELGIVPEYGLVEGLTDSYNLDFGRGTFRKAADFSTDDIILGKSLVLS